MICEPNSFVPKEHWEIFCLKDFNTSKISRFSVFNWGVVIEKSLKYWTQMTIYSNNNIFFTGGYFYSDGWIKQKAIMRHRTPGPWNLCTDWRRTQASKDTGNKDDEKPSCSGSPPCATCRLAMLQYTCSRRRQRLPSRPLVSLVL